MYSYHDSLRRSPIAIPSFIVNVINMLAGFGGNPSMHIHPGTTIRSSDLTEEDVDELNAELTRVIIIELS